ncbi:MAG TPA: hypothetical protein VFD58_27760 [Blastocatellia bacterium]|nr:hypothetical protein [Blastocatellia bacterium]
MSTEELIQTQTPPISRTDEPTLEDWFADDLELERWFNALSGDPANKAGASEDEAEVAEQKTKRRTKKEQIVELYQNGVSDIAEIVYQVGARPSYVAQVLQSAGLLTGYSDLYTTTASEQNFYSRFFRNVLAFKTVEAARGSIQRIDRLYNYFERIGDRAGQHQAMVLALIGKNRARWSGKPDAARVFSDWLASH